MHAMGSLWFSYFERPPLLKELVKGPATMHLAGLLENLAPFPFVSGRTSPHRSNSASTKLTVPGTMLHYSRVVVSISSEMASREPGLISGLSASNSLSTTTLNPVDRLSEA